MDLSCDVSSVKYVKWNGMDWEVFPLILVLSKDRDEGGEGGKKNGMG